MIFAESDVTVFVERDADGNIKGVYRRAQPGYAEEEILASDPAVVAFNEEQAS